MTLPVTNGSSLTRKAGDMVASASVSTPLSTSSTRTETNENSMLLNLLLKNSDISEESVSQQKDRSLPWIDSPEFQESCRILQFQSNLQSQSALQLQTTIETIQKPLDKGDNNSVQEKQSENIPLIQCFRALLRYIQLICCHPEIPSQINGVPISKISVDLLQTLSNFICQSLSTISPTNCESTHLEDQMHRIFQSQVVIRDLVYEINPLIANHGKAFLLPHMWRALCDISHHLSSVYDSSQLSEDSKLKYQLHQSSLKSRSLIQRAILILVKCLKEGEQNLRTNLMSIVPASCAFVSKSLTQTQTENARIGNQLQHLRKIIIFFLARLPALYNSFRFCSILKNTTYTVERSLLQNIMYCLAKLRGAGEVANIMMDHSFQHNKDKETLMDLQVIHKDQLKHITQISKRVDQAFLKIVCNKMNNKFYFHRLPLNMLASLREENEMQPSFESHASLHLGKLLLEQTALTDFLQTNALKTISMNADQFEQGAFEFCQNMISNTLPQCYLILTLNSSPQGTTNPAASNILLRMINQLVFCTLQYNQESNNGKDFHEKMILTHQWMAKWLEAPSIDIDNDRIRRIRSLQHHIFLSHPLKREMVLSTICIHISYLWQSFQTQEHDESSVQEKKKHFALKHLVSLFIKLILDTRTEPSHAKNLTAALIRMGSWKRSKSNITNELRCSESEDKKKQECQLYYIVWAVIIDRMYGGQVEIQVPTMNRHQLENVMILLEKIPSDCLWSHPFTAKNLKNFCGDILRKKDSILEFEGVSRFSLKMCLLNATVQNHRLETRISDARKSQGQFERDFLGKTGSELFNFLNSILYITSIESSASVASISMLRFIRTVFAQLNQSLPQFVLQNVCKLIDTLTGMQTKITKSVDNIKKSKILLDICMEGSMLFGHLGKLITSHWSAQSLDIVVAAFQTFLRSSFWPLIASTLSSFENFATSIHPDQQWMIMKILSPKTQSWFQSRLVGKVWCELGDTFHMSGNSPNAGTSLRLTLIQEQSMINILYHPLTIQRNCVSIGFNHKISLLSEQGPKGPLLVLTKEKAFLKEDWEALGRKFGFIKREEEEDAENGIEWYNVANVRLQDENKGCLLLLH